MSHDILLNDLREPVLVNITGSEKEELSLSGNRSKNSNGNVTIDSGLGSMNNNEAAKLLDVTESESESDLNLQFTLPKRKVRFKRKFRSKGGGGGGKGKKQGADGSTENTSCPCRCSESLGILAFLAVGVCLALLMWFHYNLSSKVDHMQKQTNSIEAQCKETPEALHDYHIQLKFLDSNVSLLGDELKKINSEIVTIKKDVESLKKSSAEIEASIAAAPEIKTLPKDVVSLSESVASIGSKISALESVVKELKEQQSNFAGVADSISKQQEAIKDNVQEMLNATSSTRMDSESISSRQQVTDAIAQMNSSLAPRVDRLFQLVEAVNGSVVGVRKSNNHTHEVVHSLRQYVHENLTQRVDVLEDCCNLTLDNATSDANRMVSIYLRLCHKLSVDGDEWANGTDVAGKLLNATLADLLREQRDNVRKLQDDLDSVSARCDSALAQMDGNVTTVSHRTDEAFLRIGSLTKEIQRLVDVTPPKTAPPGIHSTFGRRTPGDQ